MMTYHEALAYWRAHANFEQTAPAPGDLKLDRMRALLARLGDPHRRLRVVHVAGSKGKGSTAALLEAVLDRAGYRTGLFTSPHLSAVEERFLVGGQPIAPEELAVLFTEVRDTLARKGLSGGPPTFFELATAVGFLHFARRRADAAVLEVGLGGRLDSTNVCRPAVAVLTSISYDHTHILGDRLASIAREKAGIVKPGRPTVSGATAPEARQVIERTCKERRSPLVQLGVDFRYRYTPGQVGASGVTSRPQVAVCTARRAWPQMEVGLLGEHQAANAAVAVATVEVLREQGWHLPDAAVAAGLRTVSWPARLEVFPGRPMVVLDCAHNVASAQALVDTLAASFPPARRVLVFASSSDKDVAGMFRVLAPAFAAAFLTRFANSPRAVPPETLLGPWQAAGGGQAAVCATSAEALAQARDAAGPEGLVCVAGSVFLAGEVRPGLLRKDEG